MSLIENFASTPKINQTEAKMIANLDKPSSYSRHAPGPTKTTVSDVEVPIASPSGDFRLLFDDGDLENGNEWISESQPRFAGSICKDFDRDSFDDQASATDIPSVFSNPADFASPFSTTPTDESFGLFSKVNQTPSFLSLFNVYLETHTALVEISSGLQDVSIEDLRDEGRIMRTLRDIGYLGNTAVNSPSLAIRSLQGLRDQGCLLFAFTAVLKACDLVEHILKRILPTTHPAHLTSATHPSTRVGLHGPIPSYFRRSQFMEDICFPGNGQPQLLADCITTLIRLDFQLSHFHQFVSKFIDLTRDQGISANVSIPQCQIRLINLHIRIKTVIESMTPSWNCEFP